MIDFFGGVASGATQVIVMMPFDLVKVRIQEDSKTQPKYLGPIDCINKIIKEEGLSAFYKGTLSPLIGFSLLAGIQFGVNKACQILFRDYQIQGKLQLWACLASGSIAGFVSSLISSPVQLSRMKIQIREVDGPPYKGSLEAAKGIIKLHGVRGFYRGWNATAIRQVFGYGIYFAYYKKAMQNVDPKNKFKMSLLHGGLAGVVFWSLFYPIDIVKSKMQADSMANPKYNRIGKALSACYDDKISNMYRGYPVVLARAIPVNASGFLAYELTKSAFEPKRA